MRRAKDHQAPRRSTARSSASPSSEPPGRPKDGTPRLVVLPERRLRGHAAAVAERLIGCWLVSDVGGVRVGGPIVECEAYEEAEAASHSYRGETPRNASMFLGAGHAYVYLSYGVHFCVNVVTGVASHGAAVLIRALEPRLGLEHMCARRGTTQLRDLCRGPGRLCQALGIDRALDGHWLGEAPLRLYTAARAAPRSVAATPRIGISKAAELPWRFVDTDSPYVSGPRLSRSSRSP